MKIMKNQALTEEVKNLLETTKFTDPQQKIVKRLLNGFRLTTINRHHKSGGDTAWITPSGNIETGGKIYRAFWNAMWQVKKQKGIELSGHLFYVK